jgi:hypothetical protein
MKYTFTTAEGKEKTVNIGDDVLAQGKREGLSVRETIDRFLSDEGYIVDPTVAALTDKAKANGVNNAGKTSSGKRKPPARKPDETKRALIRELNDFLSSLGNDETMSTGTVCTADDCACVVRICDTVEHHDKRLFSFVACSIDNIFNRNEFYRAAYSNNALMVLIVCEEVEFTTVCV